MTTPGHLRAMPRLFTKGTPMTDETKTADDHAAEYEETKRRVIAGRASVQEAQGFIDFLEEAIPHAPAPGLPSVGPGTGKTHEQVVAEAERLERETRAARLPVTPEREDR